MKNIKCICSTSGVSNISHVPIVLNLVSVPIKHNKFISKTLNILNLLVKYLNVSRPKGYLVYQEKLSVTRSIKCIKGYRVYQKSFMVHQLYQGSRVIKKYQMYIKCIKECQMYQKDIRCIREY